MLIFANNVNQTSVLLKKITKSVPVQFVNSQHALIAFN